DGGWEPVGVVGMPVRTFGVAGLQRVRLGFTGERALPESVREVDQVDALAAVECSGDGGCQGPYRSYYVATGDLMYAEGGMWLGMPPLCARSDGSGVEGWEFGCAGHQRRPAPSACPAAP